MQKLQNLFTLRKQKKTGTCYGTGPAGHMGVTVLGAYAYIASYVCVSLWKLMHRLFST